MNKKKRARTIIVVILLVAIAGVALMSKKGSDIIPGDSYNYVWLEDVTYNNDVGTGYDGARTGNSISKISNNEWRMTINPEPQGSYHSAWLDFSLRNMDNGQTTVSIYGTNSVNEFSSVVDTNLKYMIYTCNGEDYYPITDHTIDRGNNRFVIRQDFPCNEVQISTYFPYAYEKIQEHIHDKKGNSNVEVSTIGQSVQGRDIDMIEITNFDVPEINKKQIVIITRQHPGEVLPSFVVEGMIDFILSTGGTYLNDYHWYIVPASNPDGIHMGYTRSQSQGINMNAAWTGNSCVEVNQIRDKFIAIDNNEEIDFFIDFHGFAGGATGSGVYATGTGGYDFSAILRSNSWFSFDSSSSSTGAAQYARGYAYINLGVRPAVLLELGQRRTTWTVAQMQLTGQQLTESIDEFYD